MDISKRELEELKKVSKDFETDYNKVLKGYPIQYLIGYVNFYGYNINVNSSVLIPRYETELLVEKTIGYIKKIFNKRVSILDIGTGSGCIAISLNKEVNSSVTASDISLDAISLAKKNAIQNKANIEFINSDIFENINGKYDVIISNPPYISNDEPIMESVKEYEPHIALYAENNGLYFYEKILESIKKHLNNKFIVAFEIGYKQGNDIKNIASKYFDEDKIFIEKDLSEKDRFLFIISE